MNKILLSTLALAAGFSCSMAQDEVPAFPGAEGFARYTTTGGRGGKVVHVTNLSDDGKEGCLRWALKQGNNGAEPITVVFDVSGYIDLTSDLTVYSNTTIAGQTAPEGGITLRYYTVKYTSSSNVITRFIRFRRSQVKDVNDGADASWGRRQSNIIFDHCSFSWSIDELASYYDNKNFTLQWCMLGEALANPGHSKGAHSYGGIWGGKGASFHHTMICHAHNRTPRFNGARYSWDGYDKDLYPNTVEAERVDFRNCVMYNWGNGDGCYGGPGGGYINMVNNYYKAGPGTSNKTRVTKCTINSSSVGDSSHPELYGLMSRYYIDGNYVTAANNPENYDWSGVAYDGSTKYTDGDGTTWTFYVENVDGQKCVGIPESWEIKYEDDGTFIVKDKKVSNSVTMPYTYIPVKLDYEIECGDVTTHSAEAAYDKVLAYAGASLYRDAVDARYVEEATTGTTTYTGEISGVAGIIDLVNIPGEEGNENHANFPELTSLTRAADYDSDGDGMPDAWEIANGLDPNDPDDGNLYTLCQYGWYTNLEVYLNSIVEHIVKAENEDAIESVAEYFPTCASAGITDTVMKGEVQSIEYYDLQGIRHAEPVQGINIRRTIYTNGQIYTDKVYK